MNAIIDAWIKRNYAHDVTFDLEPALQSLIDAAIAQAVQAERERCAEIARDYFFDLIDTSTMSAPDVIKRTRNEIAAAIRARSNGAGRK